jgi:hypothetical protein
VDLTFGEYLRALITADHDLIRDDDRRYRLAVIDGFRRWGIYPPEVRSLSEDSLLWSGRVGTRMPTLRGVPQGDATAFLPGLGLSCSRRDMFAHAEERCHPPRLDQEER